MRWIHSGADRARFTRVPETDPWLLRLPVEDCGRFEYQLAPGRSDNEERRLDPLNPARAGDPFGENSGCRTWGYVRPDRSRPLGAAPGRIEQIEVQSAVFGVTRHERVYLPPCYDANKRFPLVVIHDGADFLTYADLGASLNNLIAAGGGLDPDRGSDGRVCPWSPPCPLSRW